MTEMDTKEMTKRFHELFPTVITVDDLMRQAVNMNDEIERLRAEVTAWRKVANNEHAAWSQCPADCLCLSNDFMKVVRGE